MRVRMCWIETDVSIEMWRTHAVQMLGMRAPVGETDRLRSRVACDGI